MKDNKTVIVNGFRMLNRKTWTGSQSVYDETLWSKGRNRLRLTVKVNSYDFQSKGEVELFNQNEGKWHQLVFLPGPRLKAYGRVSYIDESVGRPLKVDAFNDDISTLLAESALILE